MNQTGSLTAFVKRFKVPLSIILALLIIFIGFSIYQSSRFYLVKTSPTTNNVGADAPFIQIIFSKPLSKDGLSLSSQGGNIIYSYDVNNDTLTVNFRVLESNHSYTIDIHSISATSGKRLSNLSVSFKTKNIPFNQLPKDQQKAIVGAQDKYPTELKNPILSHLPYSTLYFILNDTFQGNPPSLILQAQLLLAPGVTGAAATADVAQYKQQVNAYIESLGLNPANYTIQYQVVNETLTGV